MAENQTHSNSLLPTNEEDPFTMKVLEWSQQISHCKSMQTFYDALGKLTPQSKVGSTLNSSKLLWLSLLPARIKIQSKNEEDPFTMKVLEWSQQISYCKSMQIFYDAQGKLTPHSKVGSSLN